MVQETVIVELTIPGMKNNALVNRQRGLLQGSGMNVADFTAII